MNKQEIVKQLSVAPQLEDGYTRIADELLDALARYRIPGVEMQCLLVIIRKTYGYNKKCDWISNSQFVSATGLRKGHVSRAIKSLVEKKIVTKNDNKKVPSYQFNKKYSDWIVLPKKEPVTKKGTAVTKNGGHTKLPKMGDTKDNTFTKEITYSIFEFWNKKGIVKHRDFEKFRPHINAALEHYSLEELKEAIQNYSDILESDRHYFSHKWGLSDFFTRKNGLDRFLTENKPHDNFLKHEERDNRPPRINSVHQAKIVEEDTIAKVLLEKERRESETRDSTRESLPLINQV